MLGHAKVCVLVCGGSLMASAVEHALEGVMGPTAFARMKVSVRVCICICNYVLAPARLHVYLCTCVHMQL